jgi:hypothetical protein
MKEIPVFFSIEENNYSEIKEIPTPMTAELPDIVLLSFL